MVIKTLLSSSALILLAGMLPAHASDSPQPAFGGAPAKRIVGLWTTEVFVSAAACTPGTPRPPLTGHNTLVFNEGGTVVENPRVTPPGIPGATQLRTFGLGKWSYDPWTARYQVHLRFDWYSSGDGAYLGHQLVERTMRLSNNQYVLSGPVTSTRYAADGTMLGRVCGEGVSMRE